MSIPDRRPMIDKPGSRNYLRGAAAVLAGLGAIFVTHLGTDHVMHATGVFPRYGEPMTDSGQFALALGYRSAFSVLGCYVTALLAPRNPMRHALVLGGIGVALSTVGAIVAWDLGPGWYSISLILVAMPAAWAGGRLYLAQRRRSSNSLRATASSRVC